jgi:BirA family biotin operon repressor/biotin-[acetyl-CoA-carboxylase] ligase
VNLNSESTPLDEALLQAGCAEAGLPWRVQVVRETGSTSDDLRAAALAGAAPGAVLFAETQTAGRGRRDNRWLAPPGHDLMLSLLLRPEAPPVRWPRLTTLAALAVCRAVEAVLPLQPRIKWPNDLYLGDRKLAGLLAETVSAPAGMTLVLGIGLNVNSREFPPALDGLATSLVRELPATWTLALDRHELALALLTELHRQLPRLDDGYADALHEVRARSLLLGRQIRARHQGVEVFGRAVDLDEEGRLRLERADGGTLLLDSAENVRQVF